MRDFIKTKLYEAFNLSALPTPKNIDISNEEKDMIKKLDWSDLILDPQNEDSPVNIKVDVPWDSQLSYGISVSIQLTGNDLYQIHIFLADELQGLGLGYKIFKALVLTFGHIYSGKGREFNKNQLPKIFNRLNTESGISCYFTNLGSICISDENPDKEKLMKIAGVKVDDKV